VGRATMTCRRRWPEQGKPMSDSSSRVEARNENPQVVEPPGVTPGALRRLLDGVRNPLWRPLVLKVASVTAGMLGLAGIGIFSTLNEVDAGVAPAQLREASTWLAGGLTMPERPSETSLGQ